MKQYVVAQTIPKPLREHYEIVSRPNRLDVKLMVGETKNIPFMVYGADDVRLLRDIVGNKTQTVSVRYGKTEGVKASQVDILEENKVMFNGFDVVLAEDDGDPMVKTDSQLTLRRVKRDSEKTPIC